MQISQIWQNWKNPEQNENLSNLVLKGATGLLISIPFIHPSIHPYIHSSIHPLPLNPMLSHRDSSLSREAHTQTSMNPQAPCKECRTVPWLRQKPHCCSWIWGSVLLSRVSSTAHLPCQYLSTASGVQQYRQAQKCSLSSLTASLTGDVYHWAQGCHHEW